MLSKAVTLKSDGLLLAGQLFLPEKAHHNSLPAICLCHGVPSGAPPDPADKGYPFLAEKLCREGFTVLFFNFRGTGASEGNFDMLGWTEDLKTAIDYLSALPEVDKSHIYLLGFSAGAAAAIYVTAHDKRVAAVVACASPADFSFITEASDPQSVVDRYRRIGIIRDSDFPPSLEDWLDNFRAVTPVNRVAGIASRPLLVVHSRGDEVVPLNHAQRLFKQAGEPRQLIIIRGSEHRLRRHEMAMAAVISWLKSHADEV